MPDDADPVTGVRRRVQGGRAEGRRPVDVRRAELRRRRPLLPGGGCRRVDRGRRTSRRRSRPVSGPPGDQYTWEELPDAIEALQNGDDIDYQGAAGPLDLDDNGDATAGVYDLYEFKGTRARARGRGRGGGAGLLTR